MPTDYAALFRLIILANELSGNLKAAHRFSDADGVLTGKSGWSFGICQFDINNNPSATICLRECGFTTDEIACLKSQTIAMAPMNAKLRAAAGVIDSWDERQLFECLTVPLQLCKETGIKFVDDVAKFHLADYHNQFYMSKGGKMHNFLRSLDRPVSKSDILKFKLGLPWGKKRRDDVLRRYNNIERIMQT